MMTYRAQNWQIQLSETIGLFNLSVLAGIHTVTDRITQLILSIMTIKFRWMSVIQAGGGNYLYYGDFIDVDSNTLQGSPFYVTLNDKDYIDVATQNAAAVAGMVSEATTNRGYSTFTSVDVQNAVGANAPTLRTTSTQSLSLVGTGATGTQISATKDSIVRFNLSTSTTASIAGPATSVVTLKKCATNDSTEGNWTTVAALENDQTLTLAITLQSVQVMKGQLETDLPAGWYVKLVSSGSGTHTEGFISGEKTIFG